MSIDRLNLVTRQIFESRKDRYLSMFKFLEQDNSPTTENALRRLPDNIDLAIRILKKDDRITWLLRCHRISTVRNIGYHYESRKKSLEFSDRYMKKFVDEFNAGRKKTGLEIIHDDTKLESPYITSTLEDLDHYLSLGCSKINELIFGYHSFNELFVILYDLEVEWRSQQDRDMEIDRKGVETVLKFEDGWEWVNLGKYYCSREGNAMGHCGNAGGNSSTDVIYSLREPRNKDMWRPHLTFVMDKDIGFFGEMKGFGNQKPSKKLHPYIVELLKQPFVNGVYEGAGYLPENNFHVNDLGDGLLQEIKSENPGFRVVEWGSDEHGDLFYRPAEEFEGDGDDVYVGDMEYD